MIRIRQLPALLLVSILSVAPPAFAQVFPSKTVVFLVPYQAGGSMDATIRPIANRLSRIWGQPVIVENRTGANGMLATQAVAKAPADGYLILYHITGFVQNPSLYKSVGYDPLKDFTPVVQLGNQAMALAVPAASPIRSVEQLLSLAKSKPGGHSYGSVGMGHTGHIWSELLTTDRGINATHVAYRGTPALVMDLLGNRLDWAFLSAAEAVVRANDKSTRILAVTGLERVKQIPDVPTFKELGYSGFEAVGWHGLFVPSGTPHEVVAKIDADVRKVLQDPDIAKVANTQVLKLTGTGSSGFSQIVKSDFERWGSLIRQFKIQAE